MRKLKPPKLSLFHIHRIKLIVALIRPCVWFCMWRHSIPCGGTGSHVSTCTILLTTLPGLTGNRKEGAEQRLSRCSPSQGHRGELHQAVTPASERTAATGPNMSTAVQWMTGKQLILLHTVMPDRLSWQHFYCPKLYNNISTSLHDHAISARH